MMAGAPLNGEAPRTLERRGSNPSILPWNPVRKNPLREIATEQRICDMLLYAPCVGNQTDKE
jgi:hypothetical protein